MDDFFQLMLELEACCVLKELSLKLLSFEEAYDVRPLV
jgi:hypothetical protein